MLETRNYALNLGTIIDISGSETGQFIFGEEGAAGDEVDYDQAARIYRDQPFYTHRPGPVYTIPEEEEGIIESPTGRSKRILAQSELYLL